MASAAQSTNIDPGRVISRGFEALSKNFVPFFGVALLFGGLPTLLMQYFMLSAAQTTDPAAMFSLANGGVLAGSFIVTAIGGALLQAALVRSTIFYLSGRDADAGGSALAALMLVLPIIGVEICSSVLIGVGFLLLIVPGLMINCALLVVVPALVEERMGVFASITRSRDLTRGSRWQVFVVVIFLWIVGIVTNAVLGGTQRVATFGDAYIGISNAIGTGIIGVISAACIAALYVELREVKEGASAEQLANVFA